MKKNKLYSVISLVVIFMIVLLLMKRENEIIEEFNSIDDLYDIDMNRYLIPGTGDKRAKNTYILDTNNLQNPLTSGTKYYETKGINDSRIRCDATQRCVGFTSKNNKESTYRSLITNISKKDDKKFIAYQKKRFKLKVLNDNNFRTRIASVNTTTNEGLNIDGGTVKSSSSLEQNQVNYGASRKDLSKNEQYTIFDNFYKGNDYEINLYDIDNDLKTIKSILIDEIDNITYGSEGTNTNVPLISIKLSDYVGMYEFINDISDNIQIKLDIKNEDTTNNGIVGYTDILTLNSNAKSGKIYLDHKQKFNLNIYNNDKTKSLGKFTLDDIKGKETINLSEFYNQQSTVNSSVNNNNSLVNNNNNNNNNIDLKKNILKQNFIEYITNNYNEILDKLEKLKQNYSYNYKTEDEYKKMFNIFSDNDYFINYRKLEEQYNNRIINANNIVNAYYDTNYSNFDNNCNKITPSNTNPNVSIFQQITCVFNSKKDENDNLKSKLITSLDNIDNLFLNNQKELVRNNRKSIIENTISNKVQKPIKIFGNYFEDFFKEGRLDINGFEYNKIN